MEWRETVGSLIVLEGGLMLGEILLILLIPVVIQLLSCKLGSHLCTVGKHCRMASLEQSDWIGRCRHASPQKGTVGLGGNGLRDHGRDLAGCDCWGLVRLVRHALRGDLLPSYGAIDPQDKPALTGAAGEV